ncbi:MAG: SDR family oxidoreductase [Anaerolineae bacterium]|nr:SDR family oxidoreductase [Anaerolineae bacterium]
MELDGKTVIVTGAGSGIGRGLACTFAREGAKVVCCGRTLSRLDETVALITAEGGTGIAHSADVTDWAQVQAMVQRVLAQFGTIDLLFNNAGSFQSVGPVWEVDPEVWWGDVSVNLRGTMLCSRAVLPHMIERDNGVILIMDGGGGANGVNVGGSAYGCSKAAIVRFSEGLAHELAHIGSSVLVFCMNPGFVRTPMTEGLMATPEKRAWQTHVPRLMGSAQQVPSDACAQATLRLLRIAGPELSGRTFTVHTDFDAIDRNRKAIQEQNLYVMQWKTEDNPK